MSDSLPPPLTEQEIYDLCGASVFGRAKAYYGEGRVLRPRVVSDTLSAEVRGSEPMPYEVSVAVAPDRLAAQCDCAYDGEFCKHAGAVLIAWAHEPQRFTRVSAGGPLVPPAGAEAGALPEAVPLKAADLAVQSDGEEARSELAGFLDLRTVAELRQIARQRGITLRGTAKVDLIAQLAAGLLEPEGLRAALAELDPVSLVTLDLVQLLGGGRFVEAARIEDALAALGSVPDNFPALLKSLRERGLVVEGGRDTFEEFCFRLPSGVVPFLPRVAYMERQVEPDAVSAGEPIKRLPADELLYLVWRHFQQHAVQRRPAAERTLAEKTIEPLRGWHNVPEEVASLQGRPNWQWGQGVVLTALPPPPELPDADLDVLALLAGGDRDAAEFAYHLLRRLRLLGGKDRFAVREDALRELLRLSPSRRRRAIAIAWRDLVDWSELTLVLRREPRLRLRRRGGSTVGLKSKDFYERLSAARRLLVRLLLRLEEGAWYPLPALSEVFRRLALDELFDRHLQRTKAEPKWWLEWGVERRLDPDDPVDWLAGYGRFVAEVLRGPLTWLGVAEVAPAGSELAFRLDGLHVLLGAAPAPPEAPRPLEVGADLAVTMPAGGDLRVHDFLSAVAEPGEVTPQGLRYHLTPARACAAFAAGGDAESIIAVLEEHSAGRVPAMVREKVQDWWQRYGSYHLYADLTLIELADDYTLPELLAATGLARHLVYQFSPRLVAVEPAAVDALLDDLVRKGYTPKVVEEAG